jgi:mono/diheme cytochrome c family protein
VSVRIWLIILNAIVIVGGLAYAWVALRKSPEEKPPENLEPFLQDEDLEGRRLERVLGWALLFAAVTAVALPLYWLREPDRSKASEDYFENGSIDRGRTLFAASGQEGFNAAVSLQCATCHGAEGVGGVAPTTYDPDGEGGDDPVRVSWKAPALNTELLRFSEDEVRDIITYGRPGTPMQAWGIPGGGPKNEQAINDLVAYIKSIQLTPEDAQAEAEKALAAEKKVADDNVTKARKALAEARKAAADAVANNEKVQDDRDATPKEKADAQKAADDAPAAVKEAEEALEWALAWQSFRADVSDGQLLFELFCGRCHTQGWSVFDPSVPNGTDLLGPPGGGGGTQGFSLRDGATTRRFRGDEGRDLHIEFVTNGSENEVQYGFGGIGSGRMPGFGKMLTSEMIEKIVDYERDEIDQTNYDVPFPSASGSDDGSTTTTTTSGG